MPFPKYFELNKSMRNLSSILLCLTGVLLLFISFLTLYSFQTITGQNKEVVDAKNWFVANRNKISPNIGIVDPDWGSIIQYFPKDDRMVFEMLLKDNSQQEFIMKEQGEKPDLKDKKSANGLKKLVITKFNTGGYTAHMLYMNADHEVIDQYGKSRLKTNKASLIDDKFSGYMWYIDIMSNQFLDGIQVKDGKIVGKMKPYNPSKPYTGVHERCCTMKVVIQYIATNAGEMSIGSHTVVDCSGCGFLPQINVWPYNPDPNPIPPIFGPSSNPPTSNGFTPNPSTCGRGYYLDENGNCVSEDEEELSGCTAEASLNQEVFTCNFQGVAYPGDGCNLTGHVQFSPWLHWSKTMGVSITHSTASGVIRRGGGATTITFSWTANYISQTFGGSQSRTEAKSAYFEAFCCQ
jgi:hypothetical protein